MLPVLVAGSNNVMISEDRNLSLLTPKEVLVSQDEREDSSGTGHGQRGAQHGTSSHPEEELRASSGQGHGQPLG